MPIIGRFDGHAPGIWASHRRLELAAPLATVHLRSGATLTRFPPARVPTIDGAMYATGRSQPVGRERGAAVSDGAAPALDEGSGDAGDEATLVEAARLDPLRFDALHARYAGRVYRYVRVRVGSAEDAADLTQQVFLQALHALPRYRERGLPFAAWLFRIARNVVADAHRRKVTDVSWDEVPDGLHPPDGADTEAEAIRREEVARLRDLLAGLDAERRELVLLRFLAGLKVREIARVTDTSESTVKRHLADTLRTLKERYHAR